MSTVFDIPDQATYRTGTTQLVSALCWTNYVKERLFLKVLNRPFLYWNFLVFIGWKNQICNKTLFANISAKPINRSRGSSLDYGEQFLAFYKTGLEVPFPSALRLLQKEWKSAKLFHFLIPHLLLFVSVWQINWTSLVLSVELNKFYI